MQMGIKDGQIILKDVDKDRFLIIKSWHIMKWDKRQEVLFAPLSLELLDKLAGVLPALPGPVERLHRQLKRVEAALNRERMAEDPKPMYKYPVKLPLYKHQVRGANMALIVFGLIDPEVEENAQNIGRT